MHPQSVAFLFAALALALSAAPAVAEGVRCSAIRDAAMCISEPTCWFDAAGGKGCLEGPRPDEDACVVHSSESICNVSTLGCAWDTAENRCVSK